MGTGGVGLCVSFFESKKSSEWDTSKKISWVGRNEKNVKFQTNNLDIKEFITNFAAVLAGSVAQLDRATAF